ncbi:MAG: EAL domain-containing protein [Myxococcota bacterium]
MNDAGVPETTLVEVLSLDRVRAEVPRALRRGEFLLHYQPQYDVSKRQLVAAEGLLRWNRSGSILPPSDFVHLLEDSGQINQVGAWAIQSACNELKAWAAQGSRILQVSVNVSARQLHGSQLLSAVSRALAETRINPGCLELEITESAVMADLDVANRVLCALKDLGVRIALDDFGTGHSSLSHLYRLPIDTIKIDRAFVRDLDHERCRTVTRTIIALAKKLNLKVIAEGVESFAQRRFLQREGCDLLQGYLFGHAVPAERLARSTGGRRARDVRLVAAGLPAK